MFVLILLSISSASEPGQDDLLPDWADAMAHQGGVKAAQMFHFHTKLEFIISSSVYSALSAGKVLQLAGRDFTLIFCFVKKKNPSNFLIPRLHVV